MKCLSFLSHMKYERPAARPEGQFWSAKNEQEIVFFFQLPAQISKVGPRHIVPVQIHPHSPILLSVRLSVFHYRCGLMAGSCYGETGNLLGKQFRSPELVHDSSLLPYLIHPFLSLLQLSLPFIQRFPLVSLPSPPK